MSALDLQEQEQVEALKAWWNKNGNAILGVVLAFVLSVSGWRGWNYYQNSQSVAAATLYGDFLKQMQSEDLKRINDAATAVMNSYASSAYAARAALLAAQVNREMGDPKAAERQLRWVIDHAGEAGLTEVARLHLAAGMLDAQQFDEALRQLDAKHGATYEGLYADLRGDVLKAQGKRDEARNAYKLALDKIDAADNYRNVVQMKLDDLGGAQ